MSNQLTNIEKALFAAADGDEVGCVAFAKSGAMSKPEVYELINKLAQEHRARGESREAAFAKFATEDVFGRELMAVLQSMPGPDHRGLGGNAFTKAAASVTPGKSRAYAELERMAEQLARVSKMTPEIAFAKICETPQGVELLAKDKAARGIAA